MMKHIAVALDRVAQANGMAPYLFSVARPGAEIVFLIRAKARRAVWLQARMTAISTHQSSAVEVCEREWRLAMNDEKRAAEQKLEALRSALLRQGAETDVRIYTGSLNKALRDMGGNHRSSFALLRPRNDWLLARFARAVLTRAGVCLSNGVSGASLVFWNDAQNASLAANNDLKIQ